MSNRVLVMMNNGVSIFADIISNTNRLICCAQDRIFLAEYRGESVHQVADTLSIDLLDHDFSSDSFDIDGPWNEEDRRNESELNSLENQSLEC